MNTFISSQVGNVSSLIEPAVITLASVYVMMWGYLQLTGKIEEPLIEGGRRILILGIILVLVFRLSQNIAPLLDIFINSPQILAQGIVGGGAPTVMGAADTIWTQGSEVGDALLSRGTLFSVNGMSLICCGIICYVCVGLVTIYVAFLMCLALVSLGILLAVGPIFIAMLFFDATKRFFEAWIAQLANYALVIILVATVANLLLHAVTAPLSHAYGQGATVEAVDALRVSVFCGFILLVMRQILPMAASLASGVALSSGSIVSGMIRRGVGSSARFGRGVFDAASGSYSPSNASRLDPLSRKMGQRVGYHAGQTAKAAWRKIRPNEISPR
ncbi:MAG TPA: type IV secretion system protein [Steroidobacteraceae bacterium]